MVSLTDSLLSPNRHTSMGKGIARRLALGTAVTVLLACTSSTILAQQDSDTDSVLSSFKLEREAAEAQEQRQMLALQLDGHSDIIYIVPPAKAAIDLTA